MQATPRDATPVPTRHEGQAGTWSEQSERAQRAPELPGQFRPVVWGDQPVLRTPSSEWIDWDAIFPPGETACSDTFAGFSVPMWSE
jgi:hypothetical protein